MSQGRQPLVLQASIGYGYSLPTEPDKPAKKYIKKKKIIIIKPSAKNGAPLQLVAKRLDELSKHQIQTFVPRRELNPKECPDHGHNSRMQTNIRTILLCTNATPIRKYGGVGYMCCFCAGEFPEPCLLKSHTRRTHDETAVSSFMSTQSMSGFVVKLDITNLHCTLCEAPFTSLEAIADHLTAVHSRPYHTELKSHIIPFQFLDCSEFRCVVCSTQFSNFKVLLEHMNVHYRNHICEICGKGYVNKSQFQTHMYRHNTGVFRCTVCEKVFDTRVKCREHERATHILKNTRSKCGYCGERFKDYTKKREHEVASHGATAVVLTCRACERSFGNQRALNVHTKTYHLMERARTVPK